MNTSSMCAINILVLLLLTSFVYAQLSFVQDCASKSKSDPDTLKTYNCTTRADRAGATLNDTNLSSAFLSSCRFINCGTLTFKMNVTLANMIFESFSSSAISIESGYSLTGENLNFTDCSTRQDGGAILMMPNSRVNLRSCLFRNNVANAPMAGGGAIAVRANSHLFISSSQFINNTAYNRGGSIYMYAGATVELNHVHFTAGKVVASRGGDIYSSGGNLIWNYGSSIGITQVYAKFMNNGTNQGPSGGSIGIDSAGRISLNHVRFEHQRVQLYGAVLYSDNGVAGNNIKIDIKNMTTLNTHAETFGGVMYLASLSNTDVTCTDCRFTNAFARDLGGAIITNGKLLLDNITSQNSTIYKGLSSFLIQSEEGNLIIRNSLINGSTFAYYDNNTENAGALLLQGNATIINSTFSHNQADMGASIFYLGPNTGQDRGTLLNVTDTVFFKNKARKSSGAVIVFNTKSIWTNVKFDSNESQNYAGAIEFQIHNRLAFPTLFYGTFECYNNTVLNDVEGSAGCMAADTQTALHFKTNQLFFRGNKAIYGSDVFLSCLYIGASQGDLTYEPEDVTRPGPVFEGTWYFYTDEFIAYVLSTNVLKRMGIDTKSDSRIYTVSAINLPLSNDDGTFIPDMNISLKTAFGTLALKRSINITIPPIVKLDFKLENGTSLMKLYKGFLTPSVIWKIRLADKQRLQRMIPSNSNVLMSFSYISLSKDFFVKVAPVISDTNMSIPFSSTETTIGNSRELNIVSASFFKCSENQLSLKSTYTNAYRCITTKSNSSTIRTILGSIEIILILITVGITFYTYAYKDTKLIKARSAQINIYITLGCICLFISQLPDMFSALKFCMVTEWLELIGFTIAVMSLLLKTWRVRIIFQQTLSAVSWKKFITNNALSAILSLGIISVSGFLLAWTFVEPLRVGLLYVKTANFIPTESRLANTEEWVQTDACVSESGQRLFPFVSAALHILVALIVMYLAYSVRHIKRSYNESKSTMGIAIGWIASYCILFPIEKFVAMSPDALLLCQFLKTTLPTSITIVLLHLPNVASLVFDPAGSLVNYGKLFASFSRDESSSSGRHQAITWLSKKDDS